MSRGIVIIGANGQLGRALQAQYPDAVTVDSDTLDITDKSAVEDFDWANTEVIINAAAYTNVDGAESDEGRRAAWAINADGVGNLVSVAAKSDCILVHISTDYVFDGTQELHLEDEGFAPLSVYGASKAAGDLLVSLAPKFYIIRTSWVIGEGKNFVRTMLSIGQKNIEPTVVADQIGRLTFTSELVRAIEHLLNGNAPYGTYNVSNSGKSASWAEITRHIFEYAGLDLSVNDTTTNEYFKDKPDIAPRPLHSTLSLGKIGSTGFISQDWKDDLKAYIAKELEI